MVKMREGAWYRRRDGEIVGPAIRHTKSEGSYPWVLSGEAYTEIGSWVPYPRDLIEEVHGPDAGLSTTSTTSVPIPGFPGDLRDWFAGMALPETMRDATLDAEGCELIAMTAYRMADAMMAQRNKEKAE